MILSNNIYMMDFLKGSVVGTIRNLTVLSQLVPNAHRMCLMTNSMLLANLQGVFLVKLRDGKSQQIDTSIEIFNTMKPTATGARLGIFEMLCSTDDVTHIIFENRQPGNKDPNMWLYEIQDSADIASTRFSHSALVPILNLANFSNLHSFYTGQNMYLYQPGESGDSHFMIDMSLNRPRIKANVDLDNAQEMVMTATEIYNTSNKVTLKIPVNVLKKDNEIKCDDDKYEFSKSNGKSNLYDIRYKPLDNALGGHFWSVKLYGPNSKNDRLRSVNRLDPVIPGPHEKYNPFPVIPSDGTTVGSPRVINFYSNKDYYLFVTNAGLYFSLASNTSVVSFLGPITNPSIPMSILEVSHLREISIGQQDTRKVLFTAKVQTEVRTYLTMLSFVLNKQNKPSNFIQELKPIFELSSQQLAIRSIFSQTEQSRSDLVAAVLEATGNRTLYVVNTYPNNSIVMRLQFVETFELVPFNSAPGETSSLLMYKTLQSDEIKLKHYFPKCNKELPVIVRGLAADPKSFNYFQCRMLVSPSDKKYVVGCAFAGFKVAWLEFEYTFNKDPCQQALNEHGQLEQVESAVASFTVYEEYEAYKNMITESIYIQKSPNVTFFVVVARRSRSDPINNFHDAAGVMFYPRKPVAKDTKRYMEGGLMSIDLLKLGHFGIPRIFATSNSENLILASESNYTMLKLSEPGIVGHSLEEDFARKGFKIEIFGAVSKEGFIKPKNFPVEPTPTSSSWLIVIIVIGSVVVLTGIGIFAYKKFNRSIAIEGEVQEDETILFSRTRAETSKAALADNEL